MNDDLLTFLDNYPEWDEELYLPFMENENLYMEAFSTLPEYQFPEDYYNEIAVVDNEEGDRYELAVMNSEDDEHYRIVAIDNEEEEWNRFAAVDSGEVIEEEIPSQFDPTYEDYVDHSLFTHESELSEEEGKEEGEDVDYSKLSVGTCTEEELGY